MIKYKYVVWAAGAEENEFLVWFILNLLKIRILPHFSGKGFFMTKS